MIAYCDNCQEKHTFNYDFEGGGFHCANCGRPLALVPDPGTGPARRQKLVDRLEDPFKKPPAPPAVCHGCGALTALEARVDGLESQAKESHRRTAGLRRTP